MILHHPIEQSYGVNSVEIEARIIVFFLKNLRKGQGVSAQHYRVLTFYSLTRAYNLLLYCTLVATTRPI
jgi:hypothetical protein